MQQLSKYFPPMPTWVNIQSVMIVQPNGKILSQYREMSQRQKTIKLSLVKNQSVQSLSANGQNKQNPLIDQHSSAIQSHQSGKKHHKQKLQQITQKVIESSRKLFRQIYQKQLNKLIVDNSLVYYRTKYNIIVIVVVKKFSVQTKQIQQLMQKVFNWYYEKCVSMNIQINLPNVRIGQYEEGQFRKLQWEIANQIDEKVSTIQVEKVTNIVQRPKEQIVKDRLQHIGEHISSRDQKIKQIGQKVFFHDTDDAEGLRQSMNYRKNSKITSLLGYFLPSLVEEKPLKSRKFKRQLSFMEKSVYIAKQMRIRILLFYFCMIIALVLGGMVYFGWFRENED